MSETAFRPVASMDEMVGHDAALEHYPWLSAKILGRWLRERRIRAFRGSGQKLVYPKSDLLKAVNEELECEESDSADNSSIAASGSIRNPGAPDGIATGTMSEADALREKRSMQLIFQQPRTNSSASSPTHSRQRKLQKS